MTNQDIEIYFIILFHIGNNLIPGSWMLVVVHAKYVYYHPINDLYLAILLGMEGSQLGELGVE